MVPLKEKLPKGKAADCIRQYIFHRYLQRIVAACVRRAARPLLLRFSVMSRLFTASLSQQTKKMRARKTRALRQFVDTTKAIEADVPYIVKTPEQRRTEKSDIDSWLATVADMKPFARKQALGLMSNGQRKRFYYLYPALRGEQKSRHALPDE